MADEPTVTEPEEKLPLTMIEVWDELSDMERIQLAKLAEINPGQLALTRISSILKAIYYKHYYGNPKGFTPGTVVGGSAYISPGIPNHTHGLGHGGASISSMVPTHAQAQVASQQQAAQQQIALQQQYLAAQQNKSPQATPGVAYSHPLQPNSLWRKLLGS